MAASATFALKVGVWFRRGRLLIVSPDSRVNVARRQAETPLIAVSRFLRPPLLGGVDECPRYAIEGSMLDSFHVGIQSKVHGLSSFGVRHVQGNHQIGR